MFPFRPSVDLGRGYRHTRTHTDTRVFVWLLSHCVPGWVLFLGQKAAYIVTLPLSLSLSLSLSFSLFPSVRKTYKYPPAHPHHICFLLSSDTTNSHIFSSSQLQLQLHFPTSTHINNHRYKTYHLSLFLSPLSVSVVSTYLTPEQTKTRHREKSVEITPSHPILQHASRRSLPNLLNP
ncbi:hypothetical protein B0T22DRAFT_50097 [Podospora appendiculata]|uniref:Uncharacterized protein n=1 Tax=Podospora appendiculata TaxID=314037 RepID=A0AAE0XHW0_9PEZI|nr:hypothetical protein B0T22DRAFT_50097 [Podospora appendiculata]